MKQEVAKLKFWEKEQELLTTRQAAEELGISVRTLEDRRYKGQAPHCVRREGSSRVFYSRSELLAWHLRFQAKEVRSSEASFDADGVEIDFALNLQGTAQIRQFSLNSDKALEGIFGEIARHQADGCLAQWYSFCGVRATLFPAIRAGRKIALYVLSAEVA